MNHFATNFRRLLGLHDVTQTEAADLLGVSRGTIANWVSGSKEPALSGMIKIKEFFEIDPTRLALVPIIELEELLNETRFWSVETKIHGKDAQAKVVPLQKSRDEG